MGTQILPWCFAVSNIGLPSLGFMGLLQHLSLRLHSSEQETEKGEQDMPFP